MRSLKFRRYKAIMMDVDGTLVPNKRDGMPSKMVTQTIAKISDKIHVGLATSRPYFLIEHIANHLKLSGPSIINSGAQIIDFPSKKILWEKTISQNDYRAIEGVLKKLNIPFFIHDGQEDRKPRKNQIEKNIYNVLSLHLPPKLVDKAIESLSSISTISTHKTPDWTKGRAGFVVSAAGATKQHAIFEVAKFLEIETHEIIGMGDGYNDFPLLMACGLKVAMGNAVEDLKAIADYVAPTVEKDGVADVIEKFILKPIFLNGDLNNIKR